MVEDKKPTKPVKKQPPRKRKNKPNKGIHTCPENAGAKNLEGRKLPKDKEGIMQYLYPVYLKGKENSMQYKGLWTDEALRLEIDNFFEFCYEREVKPNNPLLISWLGISKAQYYDWIGKPEKYGVKSDLVRQAREIMEGYLVDNVDSYPTGSIFLLKAYHGLRDAQTIEVNTTGLGSTADEVAESIKKLGLE